MRRIRILINLILLAVILATKPALSQELLHERVTPSWFSYGIAAAILDHRPGVASQALGLPGAVRALSEIKFEDQRVRLAIVTTLLKQLDDSASDPFGSAGAAAAEVLGQFKAGDSKQREATIAALLKRMGNAANEPFGPAPAAAARALGLIRPDNVSQRDIIVAALLKRLIDATTDASGQVGYAAAQALAQISLDDVTQRDIIVTALLKRLGDTTDDPEGSARDQAARTLGKIQPSDPKQRDTIIAALLERVADAGNDPYGFARSGAAHALGRMTPDDAKTRESIVASLLKRFGDATNDPRGLAREWAVRALGEIKQSDAKQRDTIVDELLKHLSLSNDANRNFSVAAIGALTKIQPDDLNRRQAIIGALLKRLDDPAPDPFSAEATGISAVAAARALSQIKPADPKQLEAIVTGLIKHLNNVTKDFRDVGVAAAAALGAVAQSDPKQNDAIIDALLKRLNDANNDREGHVRAAAVQALGMIKSDDIRQRSAIATAFLKRLDDPTDDYNGVVRGGVAHTLGRVSFDPKQLDVIVTALLNRLSDSPNGRPEFLIIGLVKALGYVKPSDPKQREAIITALLRHFGKDSAANQPVSEALLALGPIGPDHALALLNAMNEEEPSPERTAFWRARAIAYAGQVASPDPTWVFVRFIGRPDAASIPWREVDGNPTGAITYLKEIDAHWPSPDGPKSSKGLLDEMAGRVLDIVERSCPATAQLSSDRAWYATAWDIIGQEFAATRAWITSMITTDQARRCWTVRDRQILVHLHGHIQNAELRTYAVALAQHIKAERATPAFGLLMIGYFAWAIPCIVFIAAFPHNSRVRALYLYNEKVRALFSLGWVPLLLSIFPALRKRLLLPFRDDLLADAELKDFDETYWYSGSTVVDQYGRVIPLTRAISDITGSVLLIGESGLGKTTFLRHLTKRFQGTLVFLKAHNCDKGVVEAIVRKTKELQSANFFRSLIDTRDLTIIVDSLNEVSADVRAIIFGFANDHREANLLIATQPIESINTSRSPFVGATTYELRPLDHDDIEKFLIGRPSREASGRPVVGGDYDNAVSHLVASQLDRAPTPEERDAAQLVLSNPMDLTYASELLSLGEIPRPAEMIGQAFSLARRHYETYAKLSFPEFAFAHKAVELRIEDRNWLYQDEFPTEQPSLREFRLMVPRTVHGKDGKETVGLLFRHDKVWDFFMHIAFSVDKNLQLDHIDDPRFRGVYLLFAQTADIRTARRLRDLIVSRAAEKQDHTLSDEFVRRLTARDPALRRDRGARTARARKSQAVDPKRKANSTTKL